MKSAILFLLIVLQTSCLNTKSSLKNIDDLSSNLKLSSANTFIINEYSKDKKYGYDKNYPINIFYENTTQDSSINQVRFLNALAGPKGEKISYKKLESCCPFPTKRSNIGAGFIDVYQLEWEGQKEKVILYLNIYEKGVLKVPFGLSLKK